MVTSVGAGMTGFTRLLAIRSSQHQLHGRKMKISISDGSVSCLNKVEQHEWNRQPPFARSNDPEAARQRPKFKTFEQRGMSGKGDIEDKI